MNERDRPRFEPWTIDEAEFYELESDVDQKLFLLRYAALAPSAQNTQPWSFRITNQGIEVFADFTRNRNVADPMNRELMISVGTAITNLRIAAAHFGFESTVLYQSRLATCFPVALVALRETSLIDNDLARLFPVITLRHTNRGRFEPRPVENGALNELCDFMDSYSPFVRFVVPHDRARAADLVARGDRVLMASEEYRSELAHWLRGNSAICTDGICADGLGIPEPFDRATPWFLRRFNVGSRQASHDCDLIEQAAGLIVLTSEDDTVSLTRAGETLELLLLLLTRLHLDYSFLNAPVEVDTLREELWAMIRSPHPPQLLLRIGYARARPRPQPRRTVESVLA